jgi:hypothetical protein
MLWRMWVIRSVAASTLLLVACGNSSDGGPAAAGGGSGAGGSTTGGSSAQAGSTSSGGKPTVKVNDCNGLAAPGVFEEITPPEVKTTLGEKTPDGQTKGGPFAMAVDPVNQGTIYSGTLLQGVWKSTDCGANWTKIPTGTNAGDVNRGMNWTFAIDPLEPDTVYTNSGYGSNGLFKSIDGGVNSSYALRAVRRPGGHLGAAVATASASDRSRAHSFSSSKLSASARTSRSHGPSRASSRSSRFACSTSSSNRP